MKTRYFTLVVITVVAAIISTQSYSKNGLNQNENIKESILLSLSKYKSENGSEINLEAVTTKKALGTESKQKGLLRILKNKFFLSLGGEKKSEIIFDGKSLYIISYPDLDLDPNGKRKVIITDKTKSEQLSVFTELFSNPEFILKKFELEENKTSEDMTSVKFKNKDKDSSLSKELFQISFSKKNKTIESISYKDDLDTETKFIFSEIKNKNLTDKSFRYIAKKSDEVINK